MKWYYSDPTRYTTQEIRYILFREEKGNAPEENN